MLLENLEDNINKLRSKMQDTGVDYCILSNNDPNFSNSPDEYWKALNWLFDFSDDNAAFLLTKEGKGYFFTDERYELDMQNRLKGLSIELKISQNPESSALNFVCDMASNRANDRYEPVLAINDKTTRFSSFLSIEIAKRPRLVIKSDDFLESVWSNRPEPKSLDVFDIENIVFPGTYERIYTSRKTKIKKVVEFLDDFDGDVAVLFTSPNDISYLLNIRCYANVPSMQVPSFFILTKDSAFLFVRGRIDEKLKHDLNFIETGDGSGVKSIKVFEYDDFFTKAHFLIPHGASILQISDSSCANISKVFPASDYKHLAASREIFEAVKTVRTANEIKSMSTAFIEDSVSYIKFLYNIKYKEGYIRTEYDAVSEFEKIRKECPYYISESFDTIFAYRENGAMPHYSVKKETAKEIVGSGLAVFDFGGQYDFGTTDTTRTILFGFPSQEFRYYYTAILKSHLFLQMCRFDDGIEGFRLDGMARGVLSRYSIRVPHSIGHGVSMLGDVHDSAPRLGYTINPASVFKIHEGMCFTVEPGVYIKDKFGIRIENTVVAKKTGDNMLAFEPLTLCPYNLDLIDRAMLDNDEISYINKYHNRVYNALKDKLDSPQRLFLENLCRPIVLKSNI